MGHLVLQVSTVTALLGSSVLSFTFVGSLHLWKLAGYRDECRDDPDTIQRRFLSALLACFCSALIVQALSHRVEDAAAGLTLLELLCFRTDGLLASCAHCLALTAVLFLGPIVQHLTAVYLGRARLGSLPGGRWITMRNYALAPFTEEFVFRACLVRLWAAASIPKSVIIFCSPFCFALAHTHHFYEQVRRLRDKKMALMQVAFQVFYTSLFGMYSNFLLLRTGSTVAVILAHSFCNHQGFPELGFLVKPYEPLYQHRVWLGGMYVTGIVGFCYLLVPATAGFMPAFD